MTRILFLLKLFPKLLSPSSVKILFLYIYKNIKWLNSIIFLNYDNNFKKIIIYLLKFNLSYDKDFVSVKVFPRLLSASSVKLLLLFIIKNIM